MHKKSVPWKKYIEKSPQQRENFLAEVLKIHMIHKLSNFTLCHVMTS